MLFFGAVYPVAAQQVLDGVAAVVNGDVITYADVRNVTGQREVSLHQLHPNQDIASQVTQLRKQALNELIDRQLIIQDFTKNKYSIPDYVVDEQIQQVIRQDFAGNRQAFMRALQAQHYTYDKFKKDQLDKVIVQAMRQKYAKSNTFVSPTDIRRYYDAHIADYTAPSQVKLRMIVLKKGDDPAGKLKMAQEIRKKVADGSGQFDKLAQIYSEDSSAQFGGDWGWIDTKTLNPTLTKAVFALRKGQVSPIIDTGGNYYLLYAEDRKDGATKPFSTVRDDIRKILVQKNNQKLMAKWVEQLRAKAYVKIYH